MSAGPEAALEPVLAFALIGALGVGSQWLAWRLQMPAIVLMLVAGIAVGPVGGVLDPGAVLGPLLQPIISVAVAIILFEGGLTLNFQGLRGAAKGVRRLVFVGAPVGWLTSALALRYGAGLSWEASAVFGGIMIVTGPTVMAPLLRQARLRQRPAALLQWEAILNDPVGALAAVLAFEVVLVSHTAATAAYALRELVFGIAVAGLLGYLAGAGLAWAFRRGQVPEYMKVPVLFAAILAVFGLSDMALHESGLLAVTVMGVVVANAGLPSYEELRRFKEHATVLLVSGVFILLAAGLDFTELARLDWRAAVFVAAVVLVARPATVWLALAGTGLPWRERLLVALTGPRGVVLVAVAGLFGDRLTGLGLADGALIGPLAFVLVAATVVLHGFTLAPMARALGLAGGDRPGVLIVGASPWSLALAAALQKIEVPVLVADPNHGHLRAARNAGIATFSGDILSEAAEHRLELVNFAVVLAATDNDAYNTLVATDLAPEFGRDNVYQVTREKAENARHALPPSLGGRSFGAQATLEELNAMIGSGWRVGVTRLTEEFDLDAWRARFPEAVLMARVAPGGQIRFLRADESPRSLAETRLIALISPDGAEGNGGSGTEGGGG